jgi:hypothetical protein
MDDRQAMDGAMTKAPLGGETGRQEPPTDRGEEVQAKRDIPGYRARRWVVEHTHACMNRFQRLLIYQRAGPQGFSALRKWIKSS